MSKTLSKNTLAYLHFISEQGECPDPNETIRLIELGEANEMPEKLTKEFERYQDALNEETKAKTALANAKGAKQVQWQTLTHVAQNPDGDLVTQAEEKAKAVEQKTEQPTAFMNDKKNLCRVESDKNGDFILTATTPSGTSRKIRNTNTYIKKEDALEALQDLAKESDWSPVDDREVIPVQPTAKPKKLSAEEEEAELQGRQHQWASIRDGVAVVPPTNKSAKAIAAFNRGCDQIDDLCLAGYQAQQAGKELSENPASYNLSDVPGYEAWRHGWLNGEREDKEYSSDPVADEAAIAEPTEEPAAEPLEEFPTNAEGDSLIDYEGDSLIDYEGDNL